MAGSGYINELRICSAFASDMAYLCNLSTSWFLYDLFTSAHINHWIEQNNQECEG